MRFGLHLVLMTLPGPKLRVLIVPLNRLARLVPSSVPLSRPFTKNLVDRQLMVPAPLPMALVRAPN